MQFLPSKKFFHQNEMACRFLRAPSHEEMLVLMIPGGPSLSGKYLDHFLSALAQEMNVNVGIIDLPNHGDSILLPDRFPLSYQKTMELIDETIREISKSCGKLMLFGQSFGARVAFDLLALSNIKMDGAFLTGFPYVFQVSQIMQQRIKTLNLSECRHIDNKEEQQRLAWSKIVQLYTFSPLAPEIYDALTSDTKFSGNEQILSVVPSITQSIDALSKKAGVPIGILQGDFDCVVPDDNLSILKKLLPQAHFFEIKKCGHFPMIENQTETLQAFSHFFSSIHGNIKEDQ